MATHFIAIDLGNSTLKAVLFSNKSTKILHKNYINYKQINVNNLQNTLISFFTDFLQSINIQPINIVVGVSSVVPSKNILLQQILQQLNLNYYFLHSNNFAPYVSTKQTPLSQVGLDILLKSFYSIRVLQQNSLILDCGTATVLQHTTHTGLLSGVAITTGLQTMYNALHKQTDLLPQLSPQAVDSVLGNTTQQAIHGGTFFGYVGLVHNLLQQALQQTQNIQQVIITGGLSTLIHQHLPKLHLYNNQLQPATVQLNQNIIFLAMWHLHGVV